MLLPTHGGNKSKRIKVTQLGNFLINEPWRRAQYYLP